MGAGRRISTRRSRSRSTRRPTGDGPEAAARDARYRALADRRDRARRVRRAARPHPRRPGRDGAARARPRLRTARHRRHAGAPVDARRDVPAAVPRHLPRPDARRVRRRWARPIWDDPHNHDPTFTRVRVREAMPTLVEALGADVVTNLARTAALVAHDVTALDEIAAAATADIVAAGRLRDLRRAVGVAAGHPYPCAPLLRAGSGRVRRCARRRSHIAALDALVMAWHGQGPVSLPGRDPASRRRDGCGCIAVWASGSGKGGGARLAQDEMGRARFEASARKPVYAPRGVVATSQPLAVVGRTGRAPGRRQRGRRRHRHRDRADHRRSPARTTSAATCSRSSGTARGCTG